MRVWCDWPVYRVPFRAKLNKIKLFFKAQKREGIRFLFLYWIEYISCRWRVSVIPVWVLNLLVPALLLIMKVAFYPSWINWIFFLSPWLLWKGIVQNIESCNVLWRWIGLNVIYASRCRQKFSTENFCYEKRKIKYECSEFSSIPICFWNFWKICFLKG